MELIKWENVNSVLNTCQGADYALLHLFSVMHVKKEIIDQQVDYAFQIAQESTLIANIAMKVKGPRIVNCARKIIIHLIESSVY